jgi:Putative DNA-binding domain
MVKNPYTQPLESFTFGDMVTALDAISAETGRLDFKEVMIPKTELAYRACAFANADGGLIIVGIKDPVEGKPLEFGPPPETDDKERLRVTASINSRVYPALPLEVMGYRSQDGTRALLVIRIGFSVVAPHEYTGGDNLNLPVRRGASTDRLRLAEIHILQLRRTEDRTESPIWRKMQPHVNILPMLGRYIGIALSPRTYSGRRRIMDAIDDILIADLVEETRGRNDRFHGEMTPKGLPDSIYLRTKSREPHTGAIAITEYVPPADEMEIFSDGDIIIRHSQNDRDARWQFYETLLLGYTFAQEIYYHFALRPEVRVHVIARFDERREKASMPLTDAYEDYFDIDLARDTFADAFLDTAMRLHRASNLSSTRDEMRGTLQAYSDGFPLGDELRPRWLTG